MRRMILSMLMCVLVSVNLFAADISKSNSDVLKSYLEIQESLANDSVDGISVAASAIIRNTQDAKIKNSAQALSRDTDLASARKHFKGLSAKMDQWAKTENPPGIDRVSCPMANASWLQKHGDIKNPYYGKKMQGCGEVQ